MYKIDTNRPIGVRSMLLYGHFIEHFHRQIYGGVYDPASPFADEDGLRADVLDAMRKIRVPILRWPGGCFVSSYHWKDGVGPTRKPLFDKAWRVEDPNTFGTDEYMRMCRKIGCEAYICTNAGTGSAEEMSDWVEYCNLETEGQYARQRIANGYAQPHRVKYWSIGNENYGFWEIGAKTADEWGHLVKEGAKMIKHVDPRAQLSAAALSNIDWNVCLLKNCGELLDWISIHEYWDMTPQVNALADYEQCMAYTHAIDHTVNEVRGLLTAMKLEKKIKIAFDEWNLRSWHHPNVHTVKQGVEKSEYVTPRDKNDENCQYTMADAVFTACFLNAMNRNCDIVGMANFAPIVNTRGCIYTYKEGIVLRSTYFVFEMYTRLLGDTVLDLWAPETPVLNVAHKNGAPVRVDMLDVLATKWTGKPGVAVSIVNKHPEKGQTVTLCIPGARGKARLYTLNGPDKNAYNDIGRTDIRMIETDLGGFSETKEIAVDPHSVNVLQIDP